MILKARSDLGDLRMTIRKPDPELPFGPETFWVIVEEVYDQELVEVISQNGYIYFSDDRFEDVLDSIKGRYEGEELELLEKIREEFNGTI